MTSCIKYLANWLRHRQKSPQSRDKKDIVTQSDEYFKDLHNIWNLVYEMDRPYLNIQSLDSLQIKCHTLTLNHDGSYGPSGSSHLQFFSPMPLEQLQAYTIDMNDENTSKNHREEEDFWGGEGAYELDTLSECYLMCDLISFRFVSCAMKTSDGRKVKLKELTDWKRSGLGNGIIHEIFHNDLLHHSRWFPRDAWQAWNLHEKPHVMLTLAHGIPGYNDSLLQAEVLTIVSIMLSRFSSRRFRKHTTIPVLLLSFMGAKRGRILQAYFADGYLVIHKTRLYSFAAPHIAKRSMRLFLQFMCTSIGGDTAIIGESMLQTVDAVVEK